MKSKSTTSAPRLPFPRAQADVKKQQARAESQLEDHTHIQYLHRQGCSQHRIARLLGLSRAKVNRYLQADSPQQTQHRYIPSILDPYLVYLESRVQTGCTNSQQLWQEIRQLGYTGTNSQVQKWLQLRRQMPRNSSCESVQPALTGWVSLPNVATCLHLLTCPPQKLSAGEQGLLDHMKQVPLLSRLLELIQQFGEMVRLQLPDILDT